MLLRAVCHIKLKRVLNKKEDKPKIYTGPLKNRGNADKANKDCKTDQIKTTNNVEEMWQEWKCAMMDTAGETLKIQRETKDEKRKPWMTEEIMKLIEQRR